MKKHILFLISMLYVTVQAQDNSHPLYKDAQQAAWIDSVYNNMSMDQKIGQLFMVAAYSNKGSSHKEELKRLIQEEEIGGMIFMQDDAQVQVEMINEFQSLSKVPLLIGMDAEWDLSMRLKNTNKFPWAMTTAALAENDLITQMGTKVSDHLKRVGAHFNFAPVVDVNVNPKNPIIGNRAFGADPVNVSEKGFAYMNGMQKNGILASAKHFPGHGDTDKDSHKTLPLIGHDRQRLDSIELYPYRYLIDRGLTSIMVAHLNVPSLEPNANLPSSLSKKIVTELLKEKLGFKGLIITDALNMSGVTNSYPNGMTDYMAFEAGNDILLFSQAVKVGKEKIKAGIESGDIPESRLEESVKKILMSKYFVGLNNFKPIPIKNLMADLNDAESKALTQKIFEKSATLLKNEKSILPIVDIKGKKFAWLGLEEGDKEDYYQYLRKYVEVDKINLNKGFTVSDLDKYDYVFISVHKSNETPYKSYVISQNSRDLIRKIGMKSKVILSVFGSPYALLNLDDHTSNATIVAYQNHEDAMKAVPQLIFGAIPFKGKLPVTINKDYHYGSCLETETTQRLGYSAPENAGMSSAKLDRIDEIANWAMQIQATPGMQIIVAKNGKVVYDKSFGYFTYDNKKKVEWDDLYDVASITKVVGALPLIMDQVDQKKFNLDEPLRNLIPRAIFSDKSNVTPREILAHQAGFYPWIPFYKETLDSINHTPLPHYYSTTPKPGYDISVAENMFMLNSYKDSIMNKIFLKESVPKRYRYSDLGYYLFKDYLERSKYQPLDIQVKNQFYAPMGMSFTTYNPLNEFPKDKIVPTENDQIFRKQLIQGYVHDQGAAMMGGVAGHAGIFSNANDIAKMMQMFLNHGSYGGKKYFSKDVIKEFTKYQYRAQSNRRGLGFDKQFGNQGPACPCVSSSSFGHSGFTGTLAWADPEKDLVYIFLSNRVYPSADNRKLIQHGIREKIHQRIYEAIK